MSELIALLDVEDVARSLAFYETALGAKLERKWEAGGRPRWARIGFEGGRLMLNTPDGADSAARSGRPEFADVVLYLMCDDAPSRRERLLAAGLAAGPLEEQDYGNVEFSLRDPDGYALRFSSPRP